MNYTTNYILNKPESTDNVEIEKLNDNMDTLDAAVKAISDIADSSSESVEELISEKTFHLLLENGANGLNTLADDWDNYDELVFVSSYTTTTDILQTHQSFYSELVTSSDSTTEFKNMVFTGTDASYRLNFRDTNRDEIYTAYLGDDDQLLTVYGRGKKI